MTHLTLTQAQRLAEGVRCPTCGGSDAYSNDLPYLTMRRNCTTCDGKGRLYYKGEWPQWVYAKVVSGPVDSWVFGLCLGPVSYGALYVIYPRHDGSYRADWNHHFTEYYPAPPPGDVLMWLNDVGVIECHYSGDPKNKPQWYIDLPKYLDADNPSDLLDAVMEALR